MDLRAAEEMAWTLMEQHSMQKGKWRLKWDDSTNRAGACLLTFWSANMAWSQGIIYLSRFATTHHTEAEVRNTILHEIAHAMTPNSCKPHGPEWQANARRIGARPKATLPANSLPTKWVGTCPNGHTTKRNRRNRRNRISCAKCSQVFDARYLFVWTETGAPAPVRQVRPAARPAAAYAVKKPRTASSTPESRAAAYDAGTPFIDWD